MKKEINKPSRRDFLKLVSSGTCGSAIHRLIAPSAGLLALVRPLEAHANTGKVMVVVNLAGGASYNIAPSYSGAYRDRNPTISYGPENSLPITGDQGLHPALTGLKGIWDEGHLAVINFVGYPKPNRSHDESTQIWQTGNNTVMGGGALVGWGARLAEQMSSAFGGVSVAGASTFGKGGANPMRIVSDFNSFGERPLFYSNEDTLQLTNARLNFNLQQGQSTGKEDDYVRASMERLQGNIETLKNIGSINLPVQFPNTGLGQRMRDIAKLIAAGPAIGLEEAYAETGGFDTHAGERAALASRLVEVNGALTAFANCMKAMNRWNDVVVVTMTEFARTMENSSQGNDHGESPVIFTMGGTVIGGQRGPGIGPQDIPAGEFIIGTKYFDFPQVFAEIIQKHMGRDPSKVFLDPTMKMSPYLGLFA